MVTPLERNMTLKFLNGYWTLCSGNQAVMSFANLERARAAMQPSPAKFEGYDAEGLACYSNVVLG
jgi:hypothetical protein